METTKDYERFKLLEFNRKGLDRNHINKIKDSISKNGYIGNPILVMMILRFLMANIALQH